MRKLVVQQWVTVDNIAAEEDGGLGFVSPFAATATEAFMAGMMEFIGSVDTLVLGANTYRQNVGYWPTADDQGEYGRKLNELTKVVASSTLDDAPWGDFPAATVTKDPVATIRDLKRQDGRDLWLWGSLTLMRSLLAAGEVDVVRMLVCPVAQGGGTRLFRERQDLTLLDATGFEHGVTLMRYGITK